MYYIVIEMRCHIPIQKGLQPALCLHNKTDSKLKSLLFFPFKAMAAMAAIDLS